LARVIIARRQPVMNTSICQVSSRVTSIDHFDFSRDIYTCVYTKPRAKNGQIEKNR